MRGVKPEDSENLVEKYAKNKHRKALFAVADGFLRLQNLQIVENRACALVAESCDGYVDFALIVCLHVGFVAL